MSHPFRDVAVVGAFNTRQARRLDGVDGPAIEFEAVVGALRDAGIASRDVDAVVGSYPKDHIYALGAAPASRREGPGGIVAVLDGAALIATRQADVVVVANGNAGGYVDRASTAPWTRPANELVMSYGLFTTAEFALMARRHMERYGTTSEQLATVAATVRNNGHVNPDAVYSGHGPFTPADILASRMIADPYHLLDCAMTAEGGTALVLVHADRLADLDATPVWILGAGDDACGAAYAFPPAWDGNGGGDGEIFGYVGRRAAQRAFAMAGISRAEVDVAEFYDPFSFEIIRQLEAFEFCPEGEGGAFVEDGRTGPGGELPIVTDGGTMSFSHPGLPALLQRVVRGVEQVRGSCKTNQVLDAQVALCSNGGSGALFNDVLLLGKERP
ncbi:thiolase family protein [Nocardia vaccinii]|uniref:thiolase family protein n=1 Tax=Nocardia vaccinii TaxID=1822 RepID=UPI000834662E|nr:thiolase family protein [Nocardia vaccinii]